MLGRIGARDHNSRISDLTKGVPMTRSPSRHRGRVAALAGVTAVVGSFCVAGATPAQASEPVSGRAATCLDPQELGAGTGGAAAARGGDPGPLATAVVR